MTIQKLSGLYYPNLMARIYFLSLEQTLGAEVLQQLYALAEFPEENRPPPHNMAKSFDWAYYNRLNELLGEMYGFRGERSLTAKAGRDSFFNGLAEYGTLTGIGDLAMKTMSTKMKVKIGLRAMAETFNKFTDQVTTIEDDGEYFLYTMKPCSSCWGRQSDRPLCYGPPIAIIEEGLKWVSSGKKFHLEPVACCAMGADVGVIRIKKEPIE